MLLRGLIRLVMINTSSINLQSSTSRIGQVYQIMVHLGQVYQIMVHLGQVYQIMVHLGQVCGIMVHLGPGRILMAGPYPMREGGPIPVRPQWAESLNEESNNSNTPRVTLKID